jgi:glycosyltransferase involved in cell wall biosynthesis
VNEVGRLRALIVGPEPDLERATIGPPVFMHHLLEGVRGRGELDVAQVLFCARGSRTAQADERILRLVDPPVLRTFLAVPTGRRRFQAFVRDFKPDVVDLHVPERQGLLRGLDVTTVVTIHGLVPFQIEHGLLPRRSMPIAPFYRRAWSRGIRRATAAICLSEHDAAYIASSYGIGTRVMGVPRSAAFFLTKDEVPFTALAVGATTPRKGYFDLLRAAVLVRARVPGFRLRIAGGYSQPSDREHEGALRSFIHDNDLGENVRLLGQIEHAELPSELRSAQVFVHLARQESLPGAVVEALASGTPVIAYDIPSSREVVLHGGSGFLVPPGNVAEVARRVTELLENPMLSRTMGAAGRAFALRHFSSEAVAGAYGEILRSVVRGARGRSDVADCGSAKGASV